MKTIPQHILIAEDEAHARVSLSLILEGAGYGVSVASDGRQALDRILGSKDSQSPVDLLILDIQMPVMNGLELLDALDEHQVSVPSLVITAFGEKDLLKTLMRKGCRDYLDKPFTPEEVLSSVESMLERHARMETDRSQALSGLADEQVKLRYEADAWKAEYQRLRGEVNSAVTSFSQVMGRVPADCKVRVACQIRPLSELGGDYFGVANTAAGCDILIADVAGHDMGASYQAVLVKSFFDSVFRERHEAVDVMKALNDLLYNKGNNDRMVTALFLRIDLLKGRADCVSAAHPNVIRVPGSGESLKTLSTTSDPLGLRPVVDLDTNVFPLISGDRLLLCTDGLVNVERRYGVESGRSRLSADAFEQMVQAHRAASLQAMVEGVWEAVLQFCRHRPSDDMLLAAVEVPG